MMLHSTFIYDSLMGNKAVFYKYTKYYINSYTPKNYRKWKRNIVVSISAIGIIYLYLVEITSHILRIYILQSLLIYFIMDQIENKKFQKMIQTIQEKPKPIVSKTLTIQDDYQSVPT